MSIPVAPENEPRSRDAVMVLSCWTEGVAGDLLARATMSVGEETRIRTLSSREQIHEAIDDWLDEILATP
ncbi:MAG TPA: hypothetical protein VIR15_10575 [Intrasporangium sp.]|uniref:hypothetical protein n=1 Tax=Intrasporangium sp. TaxID=1925024 RepID=UPI002F9476CB